jgi:GTPase
MSNSHLVLGPRLLDALEAMGRRDIQVHMGGILPQEDIKTLLELGVARTFPTGTGLLEVVEAVRGATRELEATIAGCTHPTAQLSRDITMAHLARPVRGDAKRKRPTRVIGITGSPGAGKSTLVAQLAGEYTRRAAKDEALGRVAVVAFDPMSPITSGALLGDRLRVDFNALTESVFYRSLAISGEDYHALNDVIELIGGCEDADRPGFETLFVETVGAGQNETKIRAHVDTTVLVLTPGMGDNVQMEKAGILEIADVFVCNKADYPGEDDLVRDLRDIAGKRPVIETVATKGQGIPELLDQLIQ